MSSSSGARELFFRLVFGLLEPPFSPTPRILAALELIGGNSSRGGEIMPLLMSIECRREDDLPSLWRFSRVEADREIGGVLAKTLASFGRAGVSFFSLGSALSDDEDPFADDLSSFSGDRDFLSRLGSSEGFALDDFFSFSRGVDAVHIPQLDPPSRFILGRSFFSFLTSTTIGGGIGASGTAGGGGGMGGGGGIAASSDLLLDDFLPDFFVLGGDMSITSTISSGCSSSSTGKLPGMSTMFPDSLEDLLSSGTTGSAASAGGGGGIGASLEASNAFNLSAILPPTDFLFGEESAGSDDDIGSSTLAVMSLLRVSLDRGARSSEDANVSFHADEGLSTTSVAPPLGLVVASRSLKDDDDSAFAISAGADRDECQHSW